METRFEKFTEISEHRLEEVSKKVDSRVDKAVSALRKADK